MAIFVFYDDGYPGDGNTGLKKFQTPEDAAGFIEERMVLAADRGNEPNLKNYRVINGSEMDLTAIKIVERVKIG